MMCLKIHLITIVIKQLDDMAAEILRKMLVHKGVAETTADANLFLATLSNMVLMSGLPFTTHERINGNSRYICYGNKRGIPIE